MTKRIEDLAEPDVAERLGMPLEELRELRKGMKEGAEWKRLGAGVVYLPRGVTALLGLLQLEELPPKKKGGPVCLWVRRLVRNPRILLAVAEPEEVRARDGVAELRVRVRDSRHYAIGMALEPCRHLEADLYAYEGRAPRSKKTALVDAGKKEGGSVL